MRAPHAKANNLRGVAGFTLIEILVVIVIIGVIVSAATLAIGVLGGDREAEDETRRFWAVLRQAREEAELQGIDLAVYVAAGAYEFMRLDQRTNIWVPMQGDALYVPRELPEGLRFRMWLESREIVLKPRLPQRVVPTPEKDEDEPRSQRLVQNSNENPPPQIMVLSSGEIMPFEVQIERDGAEALWRVVAQPDNDLRIERRNQNREWSLIAQTNSPPPDEKDDA